MARISGPSATSRSPKSSAATALPRKDAAAQLIAEVDGDWATALEMG